MTWRTLLGGRRAGASVLGLLLVFLLAGGLLSLSRITQEARGQVERARLAQESSLEGALRASHLGKAFDSRREDISLLRSYVPDEAGISAVVSRFEKESVQRGVSLSIPTVEEARPAEDSEEEQRLFRQIRLAMHVEGEPEAVLAFFHAVEHAPYLLRVEQWEFRVDAVATPASGLTGLAPEAGSAGGRQEKAPQTAARLTLEVILAVLPPQEGMHDAS